MSIQFSGVGSGLPVQEWIDAMMQAESTRLNKYYEDKDEAQKAKTTLNSVESKFTSLRFSLEKLTDANLAKTLDLFEKRKATSSDEDIATASAETNASVQKIDLSVESLATATSAKSLIEVGKVIDGSEKFTDLSNGEAEGGTFSIYVDGEKNEFTIEKEDTLNDIIADINATIDGAEASIQDGKLQIKTDDAKITTLNFGSSSDTSNFLNVMNISTADAEAIDPPDPTYEKIYTSTHSVSKVDMEGKIVSGDANLAGTFSGTYTFKIGGTEFTVNENTTLQGLMSKINNDDDAGVTISYDARENKLNLTAKEEGEIAINLEDTSGDFLEQVGLINSGNSLDSQTLGDNAKVRINGSDVIEVNSNTITSDMSGIAGVTINLNETTEVGDSISINVKQDTEQLTSAIQDFVTKFNSVINEVDAKTATDKDLHGEYSLISIRNSLRTMATDMVPGLSEYNSFSMVGISTGDVGKSVDEETNTLIFDKDKFLKALEDNPAEVKALLVGDKEAGITGVLQNLEAKVENVVEPVNGYFATREDSFNSSIASLDDAIAREQDRLDSRRDQLNYKFTQMDQYISQMQQQQSALAGL